jgi:uncharacterized DUF497 family protein
LEKIEFDWDENNTRHLFTDHPERGLTVLELESLFISPDRVIGIHKENEHSDTRYFCQGTSNMGRFIFCIFVTRNKKIRIFSAREDRKKRKAHEKARGIH